MLKRAIAATVFMASLASFAKADVVTFGNLSTDPQYDIIADTNLGREYLRFDTFQMTVAQTIAATSSGGIYEGWSIANSSVADDFVNGMLGSSASPCDGEGLPGTSTVCGTVSGWFNAAFGSSLSTSLEYFGYLTEKSNPIGYVEIVSANGDIINYKQWHHYSQFDAFTTVNLLLYRENSAHIGGINLPASDVSVSATNGALISMIGLFGAAYVRRKQTRKL